MGYPVQQSTTTRPLMFLMVQSSDHITGITGASPTVTISKNGAAFASPAGAVSEVGSGWYKVAANATDNATLGVIALHATAGSADPTDDIFEVVSYNPHDATRLGLTSLPNADASTANGLLTVGTGNGQLNVAAGKAPVTLSASDVSGNVACDVQTIKLNAVTCGAGVTVYPYIGTSTAGVTVDASGRVQVQSGTSTGQINLSSGNVTVAGYASGQDPATLVLDTTAVAHSGAGTIGSYIGTPANSAGVTALLTRIPGVVQPQTGDSYALIGAAGANLTSVVLADASITDAKFSITSDPASVPTGILGFIQSIAARLGITRRVKKDSTARSVSVYRADASTVWFQSTYTTDAASDATDDVLAAT